MSFVIRRVVTGHNSEGKAVVVSDRQMSARAAPDEGAWFNKVWSTRTMPADNADNADGALEGSGLTNQSGSVLRVVEMAPGHRSPLHRTQSLDYGVVLEGEIELELDDGVTVRLARGDIVIQRGTIHAWKSVGTTMARMLFVLLAAAPLIVGDRVMSPTH